MTGHGAAGMGPEDADAAFGAPSGPGYDRGDLPRGWHDCARDEGAKGDPQLVACGRGRQPARPR